MAFQDVSLPHASSQATVASVDAAEEKGDELEAFFEESLAALGEAAEGANQHEGHTALQALQKTTSIASSGSTARSRPQSSGPTSSSTSSNYSSQSDSESSAFSWETFGSGTRWGEGVIPPGRQMVLDGKLDLDMQALYEFQGLERGEPCDELLVEYNRLRHMKDQDKIAFDPTHGPPEIVSSSPAIEAIGDAAYTLWRKGRGRRIQRRKSITGMLGQAAHEGITQWAMESGNHVAQTLLGHFGLQDPQYDEENGIEKPLNRSKIVYPGTIDDTLGSTFMTAGFQPGATHTMAASLRRLRTPTLSSDAKKAKASTLNPYITQVTVNQYEHAAGLLQTTSYKSRPSSAAAKLGTTAAVGDTKPNPCTYYMNRSMSQAPPLGQTLGLTAAPTKKRYAHRGRPTTASVLQQMQKVDQVLNRIGAKSQKAAIDIWRNNLSVPPPGNEWEVQSNRQMTSQTCADCMGDSQPTDILCKSTRTPKGQHAEVMKDNSDMVDDRPVFGARQGSMVQVGTKNPVWIHELKLAHLNVE
jgi:hypothetical protein